MIRLVVGERRQSKIPRTEDVSHLMGTLSVTVEELSHVAVMIPATD